jgi:hypothetical protein
MKSNPALPGGLLTGKPTWSNAFRAFRHVGFFSCFTLARAVAMLFPRQWAPASWPAGAGERDAYYEISHDFICDLAYSGRLRSDGDKGQWSWRRSFQRRGIERRTAGRRR